MWIAREQNGLLRLYTKKPYRYAVGIWRIPNDGDCITISDKEYPQYNSIKWEDEPIEVKLTKVDRHYIQCNNCSRAFSFQSNEIINCGFLSQPGSDYEEEYVICPHCGKKVYL